MKLKPAQGVAQAHRYDGLQGANFSQATLHYVLAEHHHTLMADILPRISWPVLTRIRTLFFRPIYGWHHAIYCYFFFSRNAMFTSRMTFLAFELLAQEKEVLLFSSQNPWSTPSCLREAQRSEVIRIDSRSGLTNRSKCKKPSQPLHCICLRLSNAGRSVLEQDDIRRPALSLE